VTMPDNGGPRLSLGELVTYLSIDERELDRGLVDADGKLREFEGKSDRRGKAAGGAFASSVRKQIEAGLRALPEVKLGADSSEVEQKVWAVRRELESIRSANIGVDLDAGLAMAQITRITEDLRRLGAENPNIQVQTDTGRAAAALAEIAGQVDRLDGRHADVTVDVHRRDLGNLGSGGLGGIWGAAALAAPAAIPLGAAGLGGAVGAATMAGAGAGALGTLVLGFQGVTDGVKAFGKAQEATAQDSAAAAQREVSSANAVASAQRSVISAVASLANARANARDAAINAQQAVGSALAAQARAERDVRDAQVSAIDAQRAITQARKDARQAAEDLTFRVKDGALAQRQAVLDVAAAQAALTAAAPAQRAQAQLTYDQAVQHLTELQVQNGRLGEQQKAAAKAGIDGSSQVVAAQQRVAQANDAVKAAQDRYAASQAAVATAVRAQSTQQRQSAFSIAQAQLGVASALAQVKTAHEQAGVSGATAMSKVQAELDKLNPATRDFARYLSTDVLPALHSVQGQVAGGLLPGVEESIHTLLTMTPEVTAFLSDMAGALGDVASEGAAALTDPFWDDFFSFIRNTATDDVVQFIHILGNLAKGAAGLVEAFYPVTDQIGNGLEDLSRDFADFGASAGSNSDFQAVLDYIMTEGPHVAHTLGDVAVALVRVVEALAPLGSALVSGLDGVARFMGALSPGQLLAIAEAAGVLFLAFKIGLIALKVQAAEAAGAVAVLNVVMDANPIGLFALAVTGVVAALAFYKSGAEDAVDPTTALERQQELLADASGRLNDELQRSIDKFTVLKTGALDVATANNGWARSLNDVRDSLRTNGQSLDISTTAGQANRQAILDATRALNDKVTADFKANESTMGYKKALEIAGTELDTQKRKLGEVLDQGSKTRTEARKYAEQLLLTKGDFKAKFETPGLKLAQAAVDHYNASISKYDGGTIAIKMALTAVPGSDVKPAQGGIGSLLLPGLAPGGYLGGEVDGPGHGTSDTAGLFRLANQEHVTNARSANSNRDILRWMDANPGNRFPGMATGGPVVSTRYSTDLSGLAAKVSSGLSDMLLGLTGPGAMASGAPSNPSGNVALGERMAAARGWTGTQWNALYQLWQHESGWRNTAQNPTSTAYGIPQFLDSTWGGYGVHKTSDPGGQITAGLRYIASRYGTPTNAWGTWQSRSPHWYDEGGIAAGRGYMPKNTLRPERVLSNRQTESFERLVDVLDRQGTAAPTVRVFIGDRELTEIVRVEVEGHSDEQAGALAMGAAL
jgi:Transglycosylase SLT domain